MHKIKYTPEQINELKSNKYVKNCTAKHIIFTRKFKFETVKLAKEYMLPKEIFKSFWFPDYVLNSRIPSLSIDRWKRNMRLKWVMEETKWRKKKEYFDIFKMTKDEYIEYLEAKLALAEELKKMDKWEYP